MEDRCFIDVNGRVWLIDSRGMSTYPGEIRVIGETVHVMANHNDHPSARPSKEEYHVWSSLIALEDAMNGVTNQVTALDKTGYSWNELKLAANIVLLRAKKLKTAEEDLVYELYGDNLYLALKNAALVLFMDPKLQADLPKRTEQIRNGLRLRREFIAEGLFKSNGK